MRVQEYELGLSGGGTIVQSDHGHRRLDAAHKRLLSSLKALAMVARIEQPGAMVQFSVNIETLGPADGPAPPHRLDGRPHPSLGESV